MIIKLTEYHSLINALMEVHDDEEKIVQVLSSYNDGNIFKDNINDISVLTFACLENLPTVAKILLQKGANPYLLDKRSISALGAAIICSNFEITKLILSFETNKKNINSNNISDNNSAENINDISKKNIFPVLNRSIELLKNTLSRFFLFETKNNIQREFFHNSVLSYLKNLPENERLNIGKFTSSVNGAPLFQCADRSLYEHVKFFLDNGVNVNMVNSDLTSSYTLLGQAAEKNDARFVDILLEYPHILKDSFYDEESQEIVDSPLNIAIKNGNISIAEKLLKAGANADEVLLSAIAKNYKEIKKQTDYDFKLPTLARASDQLLVEFNTINKEDKNNYLQQRSLQILETLPKEEIDQLIDSINTDPQNIIINFLVINKKFDKLKWLAKQGINLNEKITQNTLSLVIHENEIDIIDFIIESASDLLSIPNTIYGATNLPLSQAITLHKFDIAERLMNATKNPNIKVNVEDSSPTLLAYLVRTAAANDIYSDEDRERFLKLLTLLLQKNVSLNGWLDGYPANLSPFDESFKNQNSKAIDILIKYLIKKADDKIENRMLVNDKIIKIKTTFLHLLSLYTFLDRQLAFLLQEKGVNNIDVKDDTGLTPLEVACTTNNLMAVIRLLAHQANVNVFNKKNNTTPIIIACQAGYLNIVRVILNKHPELREKWVGSQKSLTSPLAEALKANKGNSHLELIKYLLSLKISVKFLFLQPGIFDKQWGINFTAEISKLLIEHYKWELNEFKEKGISSANDNNATSSDKNITAKSTTKKANIFNSENYKNINTKKNKDNNNNKKNNPVKNEINQDAIPRFEHFSENELITKTIKKKTTGVKNDSDIRDENNNSPVNKEQPKEKITWFNGIITAETAGVTYIDSESCPNCYSFIATDSEELQGIDLAKFQEVANKFCPPAGGETGVKNISDWGLTVIPTIAGEKKPLERMKNGKLTSEFDLEYEMKILGAEGRGNERLFGLSIQSDCGRYKLIYFPCYDANAHAKASISAKYNNKALTLHLPAIKKNITDDNNVETRNSSQNQKNNRSRKACNQNQFFNENKTKNTDNNNLETKKNNIRK